MQHFILAVTKHLPTRPGSSTNSSSTTADATDTSAMETDSLLQSTDEQPSAYSNESEVQCLSLYFISTNHALLRPDTCTLLVGCAYAAQLLC
jgi:hypothetical protein